MQRGLFRRALVIVVSSVFALTPVPPSQGMEHGVKTSTPAAETKHTSGGISSAPRLESTGPAKSTTATQQNSDDLSKLKPNDFVPGQIIVKYKKGTVAKGKAAIRNKFKVQKFRGLSVLDHSAELLDIDKKLPLLEQIALLRADPNIQYAEPNLYMHSDSVPDDPSYIDGSQWNMEGPESSPANQFGANAAGAWAAGYTGDKRVYVAVLDEGIDITHPDLVDNIWTNPNVETGTPGIDSPGDPYFGDLHGWNFVDNNNDVSPQAIGEIHGTHVSGIIGAEGGNGLGIAGTAWNVTLIPVKVLNSRGEGTTASILEGLDYVTLLRTVSGLHIVASNNSYGSYSSSQALLSAIRRGGDAGILFIAAAGNDAINNDSQPLYPASYDCATPNRAWNCVISVAADRKSVV